ncbi:MAG TPA: VOC family protein [Steroidobacteraceae bacterium]|nr:VOC family protein [Steroidobacteraceae bacterium]
MIAQLDGLVSRYEKGQISRRELICGLTAIAMAPSLANAKPAIGTAASINHVSIVVKDVQKSQQFYQRLFGMPLLTRQDSEGGVNLSAGSSFFGIYPAMGHPTGLNHVCFGLKNFDADAVGSELRALGVAAHVFSRGDTRELMFTDADNVRVQLQDTRYRGGVGPLGDRDPV